MSRSRIKAESSPRTLVQQVSFPSVSGGGLSLFTIPAALADALLPRYRLGDLIAEGGQAVVMRARDLTLERDVALKLLPRAHASTVAVERFLREMHVLAEVAHPYIIPILDAGEVVDVLWYAMPLMRGTTLAARLAEGPVPADDVRRWGVELAEALAVAHARGVIHRDVKPANVHLVDGHALLADFGVAAVMTDDGLTGTGEAVGTRRYMAPEQVTGEVTPQADVYGLGVTLVEAITGRPWNGAPDWGAVPSTLRGPLRRAVAVDARVRWSNPVALATAMGRRQRVTWRRAALVLGALVGVVATAWTTRPAATPRRFVADLQVTSVTADTLSMRLGRAIVTRLEWFPPLLVAPWESREKDIATRWRIEATVEQAAAGPLATITVRDTSGRAVAVLYQPGNSSDMPAWASAIAHSIVDLVAPEWSHDFTQYSGGARVGTALNAFYAGRTAFERQDWDGAEAKFREALALDTSFAQARWGALQARKWARKPFADDLAALAGTSTVPPPLDALVRLQLEPDLQRRMAGLDTLAEVWSGVPDVHLTRANELFHRGPLIGRSLDEALTAFETAARTFPSLDHPVVWDQIVWGAVRTGDETRARAALRERQRHAATGDPWGAVLRYAVESRFRPWLGTALEIGLRFAGEATKDELRRAHRLGVLFELPESQVRLGEWLAPTGDAEGAASVLAGRAVASLMQGRAVDALASLDSAAALLPGDPEFAMQRSEWRLLLPALGLHLGGEQQREGRAALLANAAGLHSRGAFALALDAYRQGDTVALMRYHARLMVMTEGRGLAPTVTMAVVHAVRGEHHSALDLLRHRSHQGTDEEVYARGPFVRAVASLMHSELLLAAGDSLEAAAVWQWYDNADIRGWPVGPPHEGEIDAAVSPLMKWRRGDLLLRLGKLKEGCRLHDRVLAVWSAAEPIFLAGTLAQYPSRGALACRG